MNDAQPLLDTVNGEIAFFRAIMHYRPIGIHRNFHLLSMRSSIHKDTGKWVEVSEIVRKLKTCYEIDALNAIDVEVEGYQVARPGKTPVSIPSPDPSENLNFHPYFREEFTLPYDQTFDALIADRRLRGTPSPSSSPAPSERSKSMKPRVQKKRGKSKANMAGLVSGDSDSSALTQESGDEALAESVATGTDDGTVDGEPEDEDVEMNEPSPGVSGPGPTKSSRRRSGTSGKKRLRGAALANAARSAAKRKGAKKT